jgi:hypothetical protein
VAKSLLESFKEIINIGFLPKTSKNLTGISHSLWKYQFDLTLWKDWEAEPVPYKENLKNDPQEVSVRCVFKKQTELGFLSFPAIVIVFNRKMPVKERTVLPTLHEEIDGCFWEPAEIRYCSSSETMNKIITIDPLKRGN